jgi:prevent-host-death family protein
MFDFGAEKRAKMSISLSEDIRSVTDLKRHTREILEQIHKTKRPVVLTVNGRADAVLIDAKTYEKHLRAFNLARLLAEAEEDIAVARARSARSYLTEFKSARKIRS